MQRALRAAGRARGIQPEARVIGAGAGRRRQWRVVQQQLRQRLLTRQQRLCRARHQHLLDLVRGQRQRLAQQGQQRSRHQHRLRPAVAQHVGVILGGQKRIDRHRHDAGVERAQKAHWPVAAVVHQQQHPLFPAQAQRQQGGGQLALLQGQRAIAQGPLVVNEGGLVGPRGIARDQVLGKVERRTWLGNF